MRRPALAGLGGIRLRFAIPPLVAVACFAATIALIVIRFQEQGRALSDVQTVDNVQRDKIEGLFLRTMLDHTALFALIGTAAPDLDESEFYFSSKPILDDLYEIEREIVDFRASYELAGGHAATYDALAEVFPRYRDEVVSAVLMTTVEQQNVRTYMVRANARIQELVGAFNALVVETVARSRTAFDRILADNERAARLLVAGLTSTVLVVLALSFFLSGVLSTRLRALIGTLRTLSTGERNVTIQGLDRRDEIGAVARATDVFRRALAERERSHVLLDTAIESIADAMAMFDAEGRLLMCNENFRRLALDSLDLRQPDITLEALFRRAVQRGFVRPAKDDPEGWIRERMAHHRVPGEPFEIEREKQWIRVQENRMPDGGTVLVLTDVTNEKLRERQLSQAQRMDAIGNLTGGVAHDFNNLLAVIIGNLEMVLDDLADRPAPRDLVERALRASERGATLTRSLLAFSRRQPLQTVQADVNKLVGELTEMIRRTIPETIRINVDLAPGLWLCLADPGQLQNAILNLVINAGDAMPDGGSITIETANVSLTDQYAASHAEVAAGEYVVLAVSDTGVGMPPEVVAQAFEPFFTTKEVGKGTGLGLSMVYGFAKQSGGHAAIYSEVGVGTTVKIYLPRLVGAAERPSGVAAKVARGSERVLVVEDDPDVLTLVVTLLGALGYRVEAARDAADGLLALDEHKDIALLLTDVVLAGSMNGPDLARRALQLRPDLRIVLMSGYTEKAVLHDGLLNAGARLLHKPFTKAALASVVHEVLGRTPGR